MSGDRYKSFPTEHVSRSIWFQAPRRVGIVEKPTMEPGADQVSVRALCSGISHGTEMLVYRGEVPDSLPLDLTLPSIEGSFAFPIKYGYASVGIVARAGSAVNRLNTGDMVFAYNPHETAYTISSLFVVRLPSNLPPRRGIFVANIETAVNAMLDATVRIGEGVAIFGQGVVGLLITQLARRAGAAVIVTVDPIGKRRSLSLAAGADFVVDPSKEDVPEFIKGHGVQADVVIEASGRPEVLNDAIKAAAFEGRVIVVSWYGSKTAPIHLGGEFHRNRLTIRSSQVSSLNPRLGPAWTLARRRELAVSYLNELALDEMITHAFPFAEAAAAYELIDRQPEEAVQVVLDYE